MLARIQLCWVCALHCHSAAVQLAGGCVPSSALICCGGDNMAVLCVLPLRFARLGRQGLLCLHQASPWCQSHWKRIRTVQHPGFAGVDN